MADLMEGSRDTKRHGWLLYGEEVSAIRILFIKTTSSNAKSKVSFENRKCHTIHTPCLQSWQFVYFKIKFCIYLRSYICWQFWFCKSESIIHGRRDRRRVESLEPLTQRFTTLLAAFCMEILKKIWPLSVFNVIFKYSVKNTLVVMTLRPGRRGRGWSWRSGRVGDVTVVAAVLATSHRDTQPALYLQHVTWPDLSDLESLPLMESQCRSSWSSWCPSSAAAWSGRCCLVWGKLWSLTGPGTAWRGPRPGRRMCWPPRGDLPPGDCAWGRWRPWAPPPGPGSSCCPSPVWPSWSCCCSVAASESSRGALAASPQS